MRLKTACGCMSLSTGSIILGSFSVISSISSMIIMWTMISEIETNNVSPDTVKLMKCIISALIVYLPVVGISGALMIFGSVRRESEYMFPWLALAFSGLVSAISTYVATLVYTALTSTIELFIGVIALFTIVAALQIYFWLIVYSLYKDLLAEKYGYPAEPNKKALI